MSKTFKVIISIIFSISYLVVSAENPAGTSYVVDEKVNDAGYVITNPFFRTPPIVIPGDSTSNKALSVDFISKETNYADSISLVKWAPQWARRSAQPSGCATGLRTPGYGRSPGA